MKVLAITTHRPEEVLEPISHMDTENVVLNVETTGGGVPPVWKIVTTVRNAILTHDPDIVLLDAYETIGVVTSLLCLRYRVPVVCRLVGNKWREYSEEFYTRAKDDGNYAELGQYYISMAMNRVTFALASGFVVVSTELKQVAQDQTSCPPERIRVVPVSIDPETMNGSSETARRRMGIDEERVLLTVTNLNYRGKMQGVKRILDEIQPILDERSDVAYVVAGGGRRHADVQEYVEKSFEGSEAYDRVYTPGFVDDVEDLYAASDIVIYVSFIDGYPNVVLEGQATENPVVANAAHGMVEQIESGETGILIDPSNLGELETAVRSLLDDEAKRTEIGQTARMEVTRRNHPEVIGSQLEEALRQIHSQC